MKIIFQHSSTLPVIGYGGTERILFWHMKKLVELGHEVIFIGNKQCQLQSFGIKHIISDETNPTKWKKFIPSNVDIVHTSYNYSFDEIPTISTIHGNGKIGEIFHPNCIFVSKKHAELHGSKEYIHNALDFSEYPKNNFVKESNKNWDHFLFLAKGSWKIKNLKHSVEACIQNRKHIHIIGGRSWHLSRLIHNYGIVGGNKKLEIIKKCDALLFPVRWPEPFGLAIIEAMSQGIPVIGSSFGSLPELITPETGFLTKNHNELIEILSQSSNHFNSEKIRDYAEKKFNIEQYSLKYLEMYKKIISSQNLNPTFLMYQSSQKAEELLPY